MAGAVAVASTGPLYDDSVLDDTAKDRAAAEELKAGTSLEPEKAMACAGSIGRQTKTPHAVAASALIDDIFMKISSDRCFKACGNKLHGTASISACLVYRQGRENA